MTTHSSEKINTSTKQVDHFYYMVQAKDRYKVFKDTQVNKLNIGDICYLIENDKLKEIKIYV